MGWIGLSGLLSHSLKTTETVSCPMWLNRSFSFSPVASSYSSGVLFGQRQTTAFSAQQALSASQDQETHCVLSEQLKVLPEVLPETFLNNLCKQLPCQAKKVSSGWFELGPNRFILINTAQVDDSVIPALMTAINAKQLVAVIHWPQVPPLARFAKLSETQINHAATFRQYVITPQNQYEVIHKVAKFLNSKPY
jgi:hypothetical protein